MAEKTVYPKIPTSNWWIIRAQFRKTLPTVVTPSYLKSLLNLTSDRAARNLLAPLKQIHLLDDENKPTKRAIDWRDDKKYKETCDSILGEIYPNELRELYPGPDFDKISIVNWFMGDAHIGEGAAGQVTSFYILLCQGEVKADMETLPASKIKKPSSKKQSSKVSDRKSTEAPAKVIPVGTSLPEKSKQLSPNLHIDLQIHISPEASVEQIDAIFASVAKHLH